MSQASEGNPLPSKGQAGVDPSSIPIDKIDVSDSELFETDTHWGYFERLRKEDPVHYCAESDFGSYWSVTRYADIVHVDKNPEIFSSARSIVVGDPDPDFPLESGFITMDGDRHDAHRKVVQPVTINRQAALLGGGHVILVRQLRQTVGMSRFEGFFIKGEGTVSMKAFNYHGFQVL